jgi:hypothetical protein
MPLGNRAGPGVAPIVWLIDRTEHYLHEDTADGMNGLMASSPSSNNRSSVSGTGAQRNLV